MQGRTGWATAWAVGCSMGAYHAANVLFRHPDLFDGLIAISGLYGVSGFVGDYVDDAVYFNSPLLYLPGLDDPWYIDRLREARIWLPGETRPGLTDLRLHRVFVSSGKGGRGVVLRASCRGVKPA